MNNGSDGEEYHYDLLIEKLAEVSRAKRLGEKIWGNKNLGCYIYSSAFIAANFAALILVAGLGLHLLESVITYFLGWIGISFAIWASLKGKDRYISINREIGLSLSAPDKKVLRSLFFPRLQSSALVFLLTFIVLYLAGFEGLGIAMPAERFSPVWLFFYFSWIFAYIPILAGFGSLTVGIPLWLPYKIKSKLEKLDFSDPERTAGMKKAGELILSYCQYYYAGLVIFTLFLFLFGIDMSSWVFFLLLGGWFFGLFLFFYPSYTLHGFMRSEKERKLKELGEEIREYGSEPGGRLEVEGKDLEEKVDYIFLFLEHEQVYKTSEYPFDERVIQQLVSTALVPLVLQLSFFFIS